MKLQRSLVLKSCCWFPQQLSGSIGAHLSGYSHNTKHGCTLYNNLDCLLYLRVETDYIIQLGRICREGCFFSLSFKVCHTKINLMTSLMFWGFPPQTWHFVFLTALQFYEAFKWKRWYTGCIFFNKLWKFNQKQESKYNTPVCTQQGVVQSSPAAVQ